VTPSVASEHPFERNPKDDAETPFDAYRDIEPLLFRLAQQLGKTKATLRIYDPYYCEGSVAAHLARLGFTEVYNRNEDFYAVAAAGRTPEFDVLVTNPPFSGDHMARCVSFAVSACKPFFLLMPDFVSEKGYFKQAVATLSERDAAAMKREGEKAAVGDAAGGAGAAPAAPAAAAAATTASASGSGHPDKKHKRRRGAHGAAADAASVYYLGPRRNLYAFTAPRTAADGATPLVPRDRAAPLPFQIFACEFQAVWFVHLGAAHAAAAVKWWLKKYEALRECTATLSADVRALPQLAKLSLNADGERAAARPPLRSGADDAERRKWRKKLSRQRKQLAKTAGGSSD
jgi:hypothetical protein